MPRDKVIYPIEIRADAKQAKKEISGLGAKILHVLNRAAIVGGAAFIGGLTAMGATIAGVAGLIGVLLRSGNKLIAAQAQLANVIRNLGAAASVSYQEAYSLAEALANVTMYSKAAYVQAEAIMLQFGGMDKKVLTVALERAADMSTMFGYTLPEAARLLGRALTRVEDGISELSRSNMKLDKELKIAAQTMAKFGGTASAQWLILSRGLSGIAGSAQTAAQSINNAIAHPFKLIKDWLTDIGATLVQKIAPYLESIRATIYAFVEYIIEKRTVIMKFLDDLFARIMRLGAAVENLIIKASLMERSIKTNIKSFLTTQAGFALNVLMALALSRFFGVGGASKFIWNIFKWGTRLSFAGFGAQTAYETYKIAKTPLSAEDRARVAQMGHSLVAELFSGIQQGLKDIRDKAAELRTRGPRPAGPPEIRPEEELRKALQADWSKVVTEYYNKVDQIINMMIAGLKQGETNLDAYVDDIAKISKNLQTTAEYISDIIPNAVASIDISGRIMPVFDEALKKIEEFRSNFINTINISDEAAEENIQKIFRLIENLEDMQRRLHEAQLITGDVIDISALRAETINKLRQELSKYWQDLIANYDKMTFETAAQNKNYILHLAEIGEFINKINEQINKYGAVLKELVPMEQIEALKTAADYVVGQISALEARVAGWQIMQRLREAVDLVQGIVGALEYTIDRLTDKLYDLISGTKVKFKDFFKELFEYIAKLLIKYFLTKTMLALIEKVVTGGLGMPGTEGFNMAAFLAGIGKGSPKMAPSGPGGGSTMPREVRTSGASNRIPSNVPSIIINEATPTTWVMTTDRYIMPAFANINSRRSRIIGRP